MVDLSPNRFFFLLDLLLPLISLSEGDKEGSSFSSAPSFSEEEVLIGVDDPFFVLRSLLAPVFVQGMNLTSLRSFKWVTSFTPMLLMAILLRKFPQNLWAAFMKG